MKHFLYSLIGLVICGFYSINSNAQQNECTCNKDSMQVVMRFELKVKPEKVAFLKQSFDACRAEVLAKEPGCLDYSLFQSYTDSTRFCLTEAWVNKEAHNEHMKLAHTQKHITETRGIHDRTFKSTTNYMYWICPCANEKR